MSVTIAKSKAYTHLYNLHSHKPWQFYRFGFSYTGKNNNQMKVAEKQNTGKFLLFIEESMYSFYETFF